MSANSNPVFTFGAVPAAAGAQTSDTTADVPTAITIVPIAVTDDTAGVDPIDALIVGMSQITFSDATKPERKVMYNKTINTINPILELIQTMVINAKIKGIDPEVACFLIMNAMGYDFIQRPMSDNVKAFKVWDQARNSYD